MTEGGQLEIASGGDPGQRESMPRPIYRKCCYSAPADVKSRKCRPSIARYYDFSRKARNPDCEISSFLNIGNYFILLKNFFVGQSRSAGWIQIHSYHSEAFGWKDTVCNPGTRAALMCLQVDHHSLYVWCLVSFCPSFPHWKAKSTFSWGPQCSACLSPAPL